MYHHNYVVPSGFGDLLEGFCKAVVKYQPESMAQFGADFFNALIQLRADNPNMNLKDLVEIFKETRASHFSRERVVQPHTPVLGPENFPPPKSIKDWEPDALLMQAMLNQVKTPFPFILVETDLVSESDANGSALENILSATTVTLSQAPILNEIVQDLVVFRCKEGSEASSLASPEGEDQTCKRVHSALFERVTLDQIDQDADAVLIRTGKLPEESHIIVQTEEIPELIVFQADPRLVEEVSFCNICTMTECCCATDAAHDKAPQLLVVGTSLPTPSQLQVVGTSLPTHPVITIGSDPMNTIADTTIPESVFPLGVALPQDAPVAGEPLEATPALLVTSQESLASTLILTEPLEVTPILLVTQQESPAPTPTVTETLEATLILPVAPQESPAATLTLTEDLEVTQNLPVTPQESPSSTSIVTEPLGATPVLPVTPQESPSSTSTVTEPLGATPVLPVTPQESPSSTSTVTEPLGATPVLPVILQESPASTPTVTELLETAPVLPVAPQESPASTPTVNEPPVMVMVKEVVESVLREALPLLIAVKPFCLTCHPVKDEIKTNCLISSPTDAGAETKASEPVFSPEPALEEIAPSNTESLATAAIVAPVQAEAINLTCPPIREDIKPITEVCYPEPAMEEKILPSSASKQAETINQACSPAAVQEQTLPVTEKCSPKPAMEKTKTSNVETLPSPAPKQAENISPVTAQEQTTPITEVCSPPVAIGTIESCGVIGSFVAVTKTPSLTGPPPAVMEVIQVPVTVPVSHPVVPPVKTVSHTTKSGNAQMPHDAETPCPAPPATAPGETRTPYLVYLPLPPELAKTPSLVYPLGLRPEDANILPFMCLPVTPAELFRKSSCLTYAAGDEEEQKTQNYVANTTEMPQTHSCNWCPSTGLDVSGSKSIPQPPAAPTQQQEMKGPCLKCYPFSNLPQGGPGLAEGTQASAQTPHQHFPSQMEQTGVTSCHNRMQPELIHHCSHRPSQRKSSDIVQAQSCLYNCSRRGSHWRLCHLTRQESQNKKACPYQSTVRCALDHMANIPMYQDCGRCCSCDIMTQQHALSTSLQQCPGHSHHGRPPVSLPNSEMFHPVPDQHPLLLLGAHPSNGYHIPGEEGCVPSSLHTDASTAQLPCMQSLDAHVLKPGCCMSCSSHGH